MLHLKALVNPAEMRHINPIVSYKTSVRNNFRFCTNLVVFKVLCYMMY